MESTGRDQCLWLLKHFPLVGMNMMHAFPVMISKILNDQRDKRKTKA